MLLMMWIYAQKIKCYFSPLKSSLFFKFVTFYGGHPIPIVHSQKDWMTGTKTFRKKLIAWSDTRQQTDIAT